MIELMVIIFTIYVMAAVLVLVIPIGGLIVLAIGSLLDHFFGFTFLAENSIKGNNLMSADTDYTTMDLSPNDEPLMDLR